MELWRRRRRMNDERKIGKVFSFKKGLNHLFFGINYWNFNWKMSLFKLIKKFMCLQIFYLLKIILLHENKFRKRVWKFVNQQEGVCFRARMKKTKNRYIAYRAKCIKFRKRKISLKIPFLDFFLNFFEYEKWKRKF